MRSLSSIIKSGRARNQGIMNLSERQNTKMVVEEIYEEMPGMEEQHLHEEPVHITSILIEQKKQELESLQSQIDAKLADAEARAQEILSNASVAAAELEADGKAKKQQIIDEAYEKENQIIQSANEKAQAICDSAVTEKTEMLSKVEGEVVDTMITLLQHIISEELAYNEDWLYLIVKKMLQKPDVEDGITLCISSKLYEQLEENKEKLLNLRKLSEIHVDEALNDTTCKLVTNQGSIEYDVKQGLDKVISELRIMKSLSRSQNDQY